MTEKLKIWRTIATTSSVAGLLVANCSPLESKNQMNIPKRHEINKQLDIPPHVIIFPTPLPTISPTEITSTPKPESNRKKTFLVKFAGINLEFPLTSLTGIDWNLLPEATQRAAKPYENYIFNAIKAFGENADPDLCRVHAGYMGLPAFLIAAMIQVESNGQNIIHPSGVVGLMGIKPNGNNTEILLDERVNIFIGTQMICQIVNNHYRFQADGDFDTALAMYNAGDTAILENKPLLPGEGYEYSVRVFEAAGFSKDTIAAIINSRINLYQTPTPPRVGIIR